MEINMQLSSMDNLITYRNECPCDTHYDKQLVERNYDLIADKLFDLMFGMNEFVRTYRQAQRFYDDTATEWTMNEEIKCRERVLNYKMPFESTLVGKGTITTHEKQVNIDRNLSVIRKSFLLLFQRSSTSYVYNRQNIFFVLLNTCRFA